MNKYPSNRFVVTVAENLFLAFGLDSRPLPEVSPTVYFIHSLKRQHVRALVSKWLNQEPAATSEVTDELLRKLALLNIPRSPFLLSLILWVLEKQKDFLPQNHAALMEQFVETVMEKLHEGGASRETLDYRNKEDYLSVMAQRMVALDSYEWSRLQLEEETLLYFQQRGLKSSISRFIEYFIAKGIFLQVGENITFKFRAFCEFFIGKRMIDDPRFLEEIMSPERYLSFSNEIDFMTGLQRNNRSIVEVLADRLQTAFADERTEIDLSIFGDLTLAQSILTKVGKEAAIRGLKAQSKSESARDGLLDSTDPGSNPSDQRIARDKRREHAKDFVGLVTIFSRALRNAELVDDVDFKVANLQLAIRGWATIVLNALLQFEELAEAKASTPEKIGDRDKYLLEVVLPIAAHAYMRQHLASKKLEVILRKVIDAGPETLLEELLAAFLNSDIQGAGYLADIRTFIDRAKHSRYALEIVFFELFFLYFARPSLNTEQRNDIEALIGKLYDSVGLAGEGDVQQRNRNRFLEKIRKRRLAAGEESKEK